MVAAAAMACCFALAAQAQPAARAMTSLKDHPDWVRVPGAWVRPDCVHEIPNGAKVEENGDITLAGAVVTHYDRCPEMPISTRDRSGDGQNPNQGTPSPCSSECSGWVEEVEASFSLPSNDNVNVIESYWTVPQPPSENGALIFLWNGLEPSNGAEVMQTVLQWGNSIASGNGGNYWLIACWVVGNTGVFYNTGFKVDSGDVIIGAIYQTSSKYSFVQISFDRWGYEYTDGYEISGYDVNKGIGTEMGHALTGVQWTNAYAGVLEVNNFSSCAQLPSSGAEFSHNLVTHGYPNPESIAVVWTGYVLNYSGYGGPACNYETSVNSSENLNYLLY
jgi:hypothetical protein